VPGHFRKIRMKQGKTAGQKCTTLPRFALDVGERKLQGELKEGRQQRSGAVTRGLSYQVKISYIIATSNTTTTITNIAIPTQDTHSSVKHTLALAGVASASRSLPTTSKCPIKSSTAELKCSCTIGHDFSFSAISSPATPKKVRNNDLAPCMAYPEKVYNQLGTSRLP
jgi:hypothetical protein